MRRIATLLALMCAVAFQMNAQTTNVGQLIKEAELKAKSADRNPKNGKMQLDAARAFVNESLGENSDFDRALVYANRALKIAQEHPAPQDTLLGLTCQTLGMVYMGKQDIGKSAEFYERSLDAFEIELGRFDPVTNGNKLVFGWMMMGSQPARALSKIYEAIYDNALAPQDKRIQNMDEAAIAMEMALEMVIAEQTRNFRYALPEQHIDGKPYIIVQTSTWNMERPLVGWLAATMSPDSPGQESVEEDDTVVLGEDGVFTVLSKDDKGHRQLVFNCEYSSKNPRFLDLKDGESRIVKFDQETYCQILEKYRSFKKGQ